MAQLRFMKLNSTKKMYIHDELLKQKCRDSTAAWKHWHDAACPESGPFWDAMK